MIKHIRKFNKNITWFGLMFLLFSIALVMPAKAQDISPRLSVSPHTFQLKVIPGQVIEEKVKILNQSQVSIPMTTKVVNFTAEEESGQMVFDEFSQDPSFVSRLWFKIENPDFILDPGETEEIRFQIRIPDNAEPGGHYAVLIFEPRLPSFYFKEEAMVRNIPEIGVLFLTSVQKFTLEPDTESKLEISEFSLPKEKRLVTLENFVSRLLGGVALATEVNIVENPFLNFILKIKNNDIYHIKPSGKIIIYNFWGKRVGEVEIKQMTILPGKVRIFPVEFKPEIPERLKWLPAWISNFFFQNSFIGKYQAKLELQAKSPVEAEILQLNIPDTLTFFSLPWKFWLGVISIFGIITFYSLRHQERIKKAIRILSTRQQINKEIK
jgi:hypothetical protein